jgi:hypothetical protein
MGIIMEMRKRLNQLISRNNMDLMANSSRKRPHLYLMQELRRRNRLKMNIRKMRRRRNH